MSNLNQVGLSEIQTMRDTTGRFRVAPGNYLVMPFIAHYQESNNQHIDFMLRIFSDEVADVK